MGEQSAEHVDDDERTALLKRVVMLLEHIAARLGGSEAPRDEQLMTKAEVARRLGVSTRWVERHLAPSSQPARRGRAWYSADDVETQLAAWRREGKRSAALRPGAAPKR